MATISLYNHTALRFINGSNSAADTYKIMLLNSSASFNATHTTLTQVSNAAAYEVSGNGWAVGGQTLQNVLLTTLGTNGAMFYADDLTVTISGGSLGPFKSYVVYNATDTNSPPVAFVLLDAAQTIADGNAVVIAWNASGIVSFTVS
jgi:hypothetical protein